MKLGKLIHCRTWPSVFYLLLFFPPPPILLELVKLTSACCPVGLTRRSPRSIQTAHVVRVEGPLRRQQKALCKGPWCKLSRDSLRSIFYGDGNPTWAIALIFRRRSPTTEVAFGSSLDNQDSGWDIRTLATAIGIPVVWRERAGEYKGHVRSKRRIRSTRNRFSYFAITPHRQRSTLGNGKKVERDLGFRIRP